MCPELLKEYFRGDSSEAQRLRDQLDSVYALGWSVTEDMAENSPLIIPVPGKTDLEIVISYDCGDGNLSETVIIFGKIFTFIENVSSLDGNESFVPCQDGSGNTDPDW